MHIRILWSWTWFCFFYALIIIALGLALPLASGWDIARNSQSLTEYLGFYIILYTIAIIYFFVYHLQADNYRKLFHHFLNKIKHLKQFFKRCFYTRQFSITNTASSQNLEQNDEVLYDIEEDEEKSHVKKIGKHGLKFGVKVSTIVFLIVILVELSYYIQARIVADSSCELDEKGIFIAFQFIFVIFQAHFILTAKEDEVEKSKLLAILGFAHIAATTLCTGFFLTVHDDVLKLYPLYKQSRINIESHEINQSDINETNNLEHLSPLDDDEDDQILAKRKRRSVPDFKVNITKPCSLTSYINENAKQIKPFTFQLSMFYIYCCIIIFVLLFLHLRKRTSNTKTSLSSIFKYAPGRGATFSSSAGLSLVILGVITSLLTLNSDSNWYAIVFLLFLHTQASIVGLIALGKIIYVPCTRKDSVGKSHVIFLFFYFFILMSVIFKIISKNINEEHQDSSHLVIETAEASLDLIQLFLQGLLILVGFYVDVDKRILRRKIMPSEILIHLAATNLSDLITNIFRGETSNYFELTKAVNHETSHGIGESHETIVNGLLTTQIASIILGSILVPCISFHRFYSIICLVKLHKAWSPDEHEPKKIHENTITVEESHM